MSDSRFEIWAHRGASFIAPENTLKAFQLAVEQGADGVELDIQLTKDGEVVVIHDETVDRTCNGSGYVKDYTLFELKRLNANKSGDFVGIPALAEVFELLKPTTLRLNVELKTGIVFYEGIEEKALAISEKYDMMDRIVWSSFNHYSVERIKQLYPQAETALLCGGGIIVTAQQCKLVGASALHAHIRQLEYPSLVEDCQRHGIKLRLYTVDDPESLQRIIKSGAEGVFTNRVDVAKQAIETCNFIMTIKKYSNVFIFGCGNAGRHIYKQLKSEDLSLTIRFCDNFYAADMWEDAEVMKPQSAFIKYPDALFIIGSGLFHKPMYDQLKDMGIPEKNIYAKWVDTKVRLVPKTEIHWLDYPLVEHCNLNCASCHFFSNLAEECFADLNEFRCTMARFTEIMGSKFKGINFMGGEPLLHPKIEEFITIARDMLPERIGSVSIQTNGIILAKMSESFWQTCAKYNVSISISGYPINYDKELVMRLADDHGISIHVSSRDNGAWYRHVLDLDGLQDAEKSFTSCLYANQNFLAKNGRLYPCAVVAGIEHFNKAFDMNLTPQQSDSLDISDDVTAEDVFDFLAKPPSFCRYCDKGNLKLGQAWSLSKGVIEEFLS